MVLVLKTSVGQLTAGSNPALSAKRMTLTFKLSCSWNKFLDWPLTNTETFNRVSVVCFVADHTYHAAYVERVIFWFYNLSINPSSFSHEALSVWSLSTVTAYMQTSYRRGYYCKLIQICISKGYANWSETPTAAPQSVVNKSSPSCLIVLAVLDCLFVGHLRVLVVTTAHIYHYSGLDNSFCVPWSRQQSQTAHANPLVCRHLCLGCSV